jgi:hypothetical protein
MYVKNLFFYLLLQAAVKVATKQSDIFSISKSRYLLSPSISWELFLCASPLPR